MIKPVFFGRDAEQRVQLHLGGREERGDRAGRLPGELHQHHRHFDPVLHEEVAAKTRFQWSFAMSEQFVLAKLEHLQLKPPFRQLMFKIEKRMSLLFQPRTFQWDDQRLFFNSEGQLPEEVLIKNTHFNSIAQKNDVFSPGLQPRIVSNSAKKPNRVAWKDAHEKNKLVTMFIPSYDNIDFEKRERVKKKEGSKFETQVLYYNYQKQFRIQKQTKISQMELPQDQQPGTLLQ